MSSACPSSGPEAGQHLQAGQGLEHDDEIDQQAGKFSMSMLWSGSTLLARCSAIVCVVIGRPQESNM